MVCAKCQKKLKRTELATPGVKRKSEMYYGSPSSTLGGGGDAKANRAGAGGSATLGNTGVSKVWFYSLGLFYFSMGRHVLRIYMLISDGTVRINSSVRKRKIPMLLTRLRVSLVRPRSSRGGGFARGVRIRRMVCSLFIPLLYSSCLACNSC